MFIGFLLGYSNLRSIHKSLKVHLDLLVDFLWVDDKTIEGLMSLTGRFFEFVSVLMIISY